jgi:hypothetical protein
MPSEYFIDALPSRLLHEILRCAAFRVVHLVSSPETPIRSITHLGQAKLDKRAALISKKRKREDDAAAAAAAAEMALSASAPQPSDPAILGTVKSIRASLKKQVGLEPLVASKSLRRSGIAHHAEYVVLSNFTGPRCLGLLRAERLPKLVQTRAAWNQRRGLCASGALAIHPNTKRSIHNKTGLLRSPPPPVRWRMQAGKPADKTLSTFIKKAGIITVSSVDIAELMGLKSGEELPTKSARMTTLKPDDTGARPPDTQVMSSSTASGGLWGGTIACCVLPAPNGCAFVSRSWPQLC